MKAHIRHQHVEICYSDCHPTKTTLEIQDLDKEERRKLFLKIWFGGWGLAVACVFLPMIHFVLVPALLIGSPIAASYKAKQTSVVLGGKGICPACKAELKISKGPVKWPLEETCTACWRETIIKPISL